jgi:hypothetical protein
MASKTLYVRVAPKTGSQKFHRCGIAFTRAWQKVEVDEATAKRLKEEQMLEVSDKEPADYVAPGTPATATASAHAAPVAPTDPAERAAAIKSAIAKLDTTDASLWTGTGMPKVPAIAAVTGWEVTQAERDAVWSEINKAA